MGERISGALTGINSYQLLLFPFAVEQISATTMTRHFLSLSSESHADMRRYWSEFIVLNYGVMHSFRNTFKLTNNTLLVYHIARIVRDDAVILVCNIN
jgi:hypothetical protein